MPSCENIQPDTRFFGLFLGRSGSGKTAAGLSFPHPIKVYDLDGRVRGGLQPWVEKKGIDYEYYPPKDTNMVFKQLDNAMATDLILARSGKFPYKTIILDSLTWAATDFLLDAIPLAHADNKGKMMGSLQIAGPSEYSFQSTAIWQMIAFLKTLPVQNVIVTAHIVSRWGKRKKPDGTIVDPYGPNEIIGEQLFLTDKLAEAVPSSFDHIFRFEKSDDGRQFWFEAHGELPRSAFKLPFGRIDISNKSFYETMMKTAGVSIATS